MAKELAPRSFDDVRRAMDDVVQIELQRPGQRPALQLRLQQRATEGIPGVIYDTAYAMAQLLLIDPEWSAALGPGARVLEIGCGCGLVGLAAAHVGGAHVTLTDLSEAALALAGVNAALNGVPAATHSYALGDTDLAAAFPASGGSFDVILASDVIYQDDTPPLLVQSLVALLRCRPNGAPPALALLGFKKRNARRERLLLRALGESSDLQVEPVEARLPPCLLARGLEPACFGLLRITIAPPPPLLLLANTEYNT
jgi:SAM-dependent methyltransferase